MKSNLRIAALATNLTLLAGCSLFSLTPDADVVAQVHRQVPLGISLDSAEANLAALGFNCARQRGAYTDEHGNDHEDAHFMRCARRPGTISVACANRDQVVVVPGDTGKVTAVEVSHGPDCSR